MILPVQWKSFAGSFDCYNGGCRKKCFRRHRPFESKYNTETMILQVLLQKNIEYCKRFENFIIRDILCCEVDTA